MDQLDQGISYMRADAEVWQQMFDLYESMINPVGNMTGVQLLMDDTYVQRMMNGYTRLCQTNDDQLDDVLLTVKNNAFVNRLLAVAALNPFDTTEALNILSKTGMDTASAPDVNSDGVPDYATVQSGSVTWQENGAFTAETDCTVLVSTQAPDDGDYVLTVDASDRSGVSGVTIAGNAVAYDAATGACAAYDDWASDITEIAVSVKAGTTVNRITYIKA